MSQIQKDEETKRRVSATMRGTAAMVPVTPTPPLPDTLVRPFTPTGTPTRQAQTLTQALAQRNGDAVKRRASESSVNSLEGKGLSQIERDEQIKRRVSSTMIKMPVLEASPKSQVPSSLAVPSLKYSPGRGPARQPAEADTSMTQWSTASDRSASPRPSPVAPSRNSLIMPAPSTSPSTPRTFAVAFPKARTPNKSPSTPSYPTADTERRPSLPLIPLAPTGALHEKRHLGEKKTRISLPPRAALATAATNQKRSSLPATALVTRSPVTTPQRRLGDKKQRVSLPTSSALQQAASTAGTTPPSSPATIQPQQQQPQQQPQQQQQYKPVKKLGERKKHRVSLPTSAAVAATAAAVAAGTSMSRSEDEEEEEQEEQQVAAVRRVSNPSNDNVIRKKGLAGNRISNPPQMLAGPGAFFVSGGEVVEENDGDDEDNVNNNDETATGDFENDPNGLDELEVQVVAEDPDIELGRPAVEELSRAFSSRPSMRPSFTAQGSAAARLRANVHDFSEDEGDEEVQKKGCFSWILNAPWWCNIIVPLLFAAGIVATITFLAKSFRTDNNTVQKEEDRGTTQMATNAPTVPILNDFFSNETLPEFTIEALSDRNSPQSKAKEWLEKDPNIVSYDSSRKKQRFALASFYFSTNGARWKDSSNWLSYTAHECLWFSSMNETLEMGYSSDSLVKSPNETVAKTVNCNDKSEYENLLLAADSLRGTIPPEISFLTQLVQISLEGNLIFGAIPSQLDALSKLTSLGLSQNQLESSIPTELYRLSNSLERLYLRSNSLTGTLSTQMAQLRKLVALHVTDNQLTGTIPTLLGLLTKLDTLRLGENSLTGRIPKEISNCRELQFLNLWENPLRGGLPAELGTLTKLTFLGFGKSQLDSTLPTEFAQLTNLQTLLATNSGLKGTIPTEIANMRGLTSISLGVNHFTGTIPSQIGQLSNLEELRLFDNKLVGPIPSEIGNISNLYRLEAHQNQFTSTIPSEIGRLEYLTSIRLFNTPLAGSLPVQISKLSYLEVLEISNTDITGAIPNDTCELEASGQLTISADCSSVKVICCDA